eukprot:3846127-Rhodomonas_salina.3
MNPDTFKLAHLLEIGSRPGEQTLLSVGEEVEDICGGSGKELQIEVRPACGLPLNQSGSGLGQS